MATEHSQTVLREGLYELALDALRAGIRPNEVMVETVSALREAARQEHESVDYYLSKVRGQL